MIDSFSLEIVTPRKMVLKKEGVTEMSAPGYGGYFTVLPSHTPYLVMLSEGILSYKINRKKHYLSVMNGFVEVLPDRVIALAEKCETAEEIDLKRAKSAKERAEKRLQGTENRDIDFDRARAALQRAIIRIRAKEEEQD